MNPFDPLSDAGADAGVDVDVGAIAVDASQLTGQLLVVAVATLFFVRFTRRAIGRVDDPRAREQLLFCAPKGVAVLATVSGLMVVGIDISGMAAVLATIGFTGAVVFTPVGQNFVAGAMIAMDDLCRPGEIVTVGEVHGRVVYRALLRTEILLPDDTRAWVPNSAFQEHDVHNHSRMGGTRIAVRVPVERSTDRRRAVEIMETVVVAQPWTSTGKDPFVAFDEVAGDAMMFIAYVWIDDRTQEPYYRGRLLTALVDALEADRISVGQTTHLAIGQGVTAPSATR
ncbi:MAG: mechanosensitive ion channel domain-containing protein [Actinomycetota bacterium]